MLTNPQRGEVWRVELDPVRGSEQAKTRPVVVLSMLGVGRPSMRVCTPIVHWQAAHLAMFWCVRLTPNTANNLTKDSSVDASQVRSLDVARFVDHLGVLDTDTISAIAAAVALCVGYVSPATSSATSPAIEPR